MVEDSKKWNLRPAQRLATAIVAGLALTLMALAWPALVRGAQSPDIIGVEVTSSKGTFFYSPLTDTGGTAHFNNLSGEGADQIITVTVVVSDDNPTTFEGGYAFGITPTTNISNSYGVTSTWSVTYTIRAADTSENGVLFTITDSDNFTDTITITFTQDITDPGVSSPDIIENSQYLHAVGSTAVYYGDDMPTAVPFTVTGNASDGGVGLDRATFSTALDDTPPDDTDPGAWAGIYTADSTNTTSVGTIVVTIYDKVGNSITQTFTYIRDVWGPNEVPGFTNIPDADSGNDGFDPNTNWEDDLTVDLTWATPSDQGGSGIAGYQLSSSSPVTTAFYTTTSGGLTMNDEGIYNIVVRAQDNVGNLGSMNFVGPIQFDQDAPVNGRLNLNEESGGEYLYIADDTSITTGTLFYNHVAASSFTITADDTGSFGWGDIGSIPWKVAFSPGWGESSISEDFSSPYTHTYSITPLETTDVFTVYYVNRAGNVLSIPIDAVLDTEVPQVVFTDVTDSDYDPDGDELDASNNWYRTSTLGSGWSFTSTVTETLSGVFQSYAYWDHSVATNNQSIPAPGGDGTFSNVHDDSDGTVQVTVIVTDHVNNVGSDTLTIQLDGTPPVITPIGWSETSEYLHIIGDELFFSQVMTESQTATLSGDAADNLGGSGLDHATFSNEPNLAGSPPDDDSADNWSCQYTFAITSTQGDGQAVVTVYDHVGNTTAANFAYTLDDAPPVVTYTNVTDPGYDPDGNELNDTGNWYTSSNFDGPTNDDWGFYFDFSDSQAGARSASADWDHSNDSDDQIGYDPGLDGDGIFGTGSDSSGNSVRDDADGVVTVTLRIEDYVGNQGFDSLTLRIDNTPPTITSGGWSESSESLHVDGSTLYFSHQMGASDQQATLSGQANDGAGSGPDRMTFSTEPNLAGSPGPDDTATDWSGNYTFNSGSDQGDGTVVITLTDHLGNLVTGTYTYVLDVILPTTPTNFVINTPPVIPGYYNTQSLDLSWDPSNENGSGLRGYYLDTSNPPSSFYSPTVTAALYDVGSDGVFTFYLAAKDNVDNTSLTSTGPITVDTQGPVSYVTATPEEAQQRFLVEWGADDITTWPVNYDVQYRVNGGAWTPWLSATSVISQYFGPVEIGDTYEFQVRARDYVTNQGAWTNSGTSQVSQRFIYVPVLFRNIDLSIPFFVSGDFESGTFAGWEAGGALPHSIVSPPPGGSGKAALLGSPSYGNGCSAQTVPVGQAYIQAYANVPDTGTPYLRFDYRVFSYDTVRSSGGEWWDRLEVQVSGATLQDTGSSDLGYYNPYGNPNNHNLNLCQQYDSGWRQGEINLSTYKGRIILLTFFNENHSDGWYNTYTYLDNIRIEN